MGRNNGKTKNGIPCRAPWSMRLQKLHGRSCEGQARAAEMRGLMQSRPPEPGSLAVPVAAQNAPTTLRTPWACGRGSNVRVDVVRQPHDSRRAPPTRMPASKPKSHLPDGSFPGGAPDQPLPAEAQPIANPAAGTLPLPVWLSAQVFPVRVCYTTACKGDQAQSLQPRGTCPAQPPDRCRHSCFPALRT